MTLTLKEQGLNVPYLIRNEWYLGYTREVIFVTGGYSVPELNEGFIQENREPPSAGELFTAKYSVIQLKDYFSISELISAGYTIHNLIDAAYTIQQLRNNFSISDLKSAGYSDQQIMGAGFTDYELYSAGYTDIYFQKVCETCADNSTTNYSVAYKPLKTMRHTDNISQKMKQAAFVRRTQNTTIDQKDAINFRFKNL